LKRGTEKSAIFYGHLNDNDGASSTHPADRYTEYNDVDNGWSKLPANWSYTLVNQGQMDIYDKWVEHLFK
jgi:hypothetical protein